jgi:hypothetical protein
MVKCMASTLAKQVLSVYIFILAKLECQHLTDSKLTIHKIFHIQHTYQNQFVEKANL